MARMLTIGEHKDFALFLLEMHGVGAIDRAGERASASARDGREQDAVNWLRIGEEIARILN